MNKNENRILNTVLLVMFLVAVYTITLWAQVPPQYRVREGRKQMANYDQLLQLKAVEVTSVSAITAFDVTATFTPSVSYLPADVEFPVKLVIKNQNADSAVVYVPYVTNTTGVVIPTATAAKLLNQLGVVIKDGKSAEMILYQDPLISFGAITTTPSDARADKTLIFEVWKRSQIDY